MILAVLALSFTVLAGDPLEEDSSVIVPMVNSAQISEDYRRFVSHGEPFPSTPEVKYLFALDPAIAPPHLVGAVLGWLRVQYPNVDRRSVEELGFDEAADPRGAAARAKLLKWVLAASMKDEQRRGLAFAILTREADRDCRAAVTLALGERFVQGDDLGLSDALLRFVESDSAWANEGEKILAIRALATLVTILPENDGNEVRRCLKEFAVTNSTPLSKQAVLSLGAGMPRAGRLGFIVEVMTSGRYSNLAKIGALDLVQEDISLSGEFHPTVAHALRTSANDGSQNETVAGQIQRLLKDNAGSAASDDDDCVTILPLLVRPKKP